MGKYVLVYWVKSYGLCPNVLFFNKRNIPSVINAPAVSSAAIKAQSITVPSTPLLTRYFVQTHAITDNSAKAPDKIYPLFHLRNSNLIIIPIKNGNTKIIKAVLFMQSRSYTRLQFILLVYYYIIYLFSICLNPNRKTYKL